MRWTIPALLLLPLQACIYYDGQGECDGDCWGDWDDTASIDDTGAPDTTDTDTDEDTSADSGDTSDTCDTAEDTADDPIPLSLVLTPGDATPCSTFIASLTDEFGLFDLSGTVGAQFFGAAHVLALQARPDEVILSVAVDAAATPGSIDLLIEFSDGTAAFADNALTIVAATTSDPLADCICGDAP